MQREYGTGEGTGEEEGGGNPKEDAGGGARLRRGRKPLPSPVGANEGGRGGEAEE